MEGQGSTESRVDLIFGTHTDKNEHQLHALDENASAFLESHPDGRVTILREDAGFSQNESMAVFSFVRQGMSPSDAVAQTEFIVEHLRYPSTIELEEWKEVHSPKEGTFTRSELDVLDELCRKFPGKIDVLTEFMPEDEHEEQPFVYDQELQDRFFGNAMNGNFDEAVREYKDYIQRFARAVQKRDKRIVDMIHASAGNRKTDLLITGFFGAGHTGIYHQIDKGEIKTTRSYPDKSDGLYLFDPFSAMLRRQLSSDQPIEEVEWLRSLMRLVERRLLEVVTEDLEDGMSGQQLTKALGRDFMDMSLDEISEFEEEVRKTSFINAIERSASVDEHDEV